jgi:excisionase family DNA binding protein
MESLLTVEEVAQILRIKPSTVYDWVYAGVLPAVRPMTGPHRSIVRFRGADIEKFIQDHTRQGGR